MKKLISMTIDICIEDDYIDKVKELIDNIEDDTTIINKVISLMNAKYHINYNGEEINNYKGPRLQSITDRVSLVCEYITKGIDIRLIISRLAKNITETIKEKKENINE